MEYFKGNLRKIQPNNNKKKPCNLKMNWII